MSASRMEERYVRLAQLRDEIRFPPELKDRLFYDSSGQRLVLRGCMSRKDRNRLVRLDSTFPYQQAVHRLYMASRSRMSWGSILIALLILGCLALAAINRLTR